MIARSFRPIIYLTLCLLLVNCSWLPTRYFEPEQQPKAATLANLKPALMPDRSAVLPVLDLNSLVETYRQVLEVTRDPEIRLQVLHRLAGLEMQRGEQQLFDQKMLGNEFDLAIDAYRTLLKNHPDHINNDRLLYQLSKAYDLGGQIDQSMAVLDRLVVKYPSSVHYGEAQFRRAEIFFSQSDYRNAELAYAEVVGQGEDHRHFPNALYMHGWSQFKQERYRASLSSFSGVLDLNVPVDNNLDSMARGKRELTLDTFRIMSVAFSYLDGPKTIVDVYQSLGERHYLPLLYENLGKLYLQKERYRDSAEAYRTFIDNYPQSDQSPVFYARLISAYRDGGFPDDVLIEKENYVAYYGIHSDYWQQKTESSRDYIRPSLEQYLPELARHYHAKAQELNAQLSQPASVKRPSIKLKSNQLIPIDLKSIKQRQAAMLSRYLQAGTYYQEFIDTFPEDDQVPEMLFLLAESRFEAKIYDQAIDAYEVVAYKYPEHKRGTAAGYAAIVSYGLLLAELPDDGVSADDNVAVADKVMATINSHEKWLRLKIASQLRFANVYQSDARASAVLVKSAEELLALEEYQHALRAAQQLTRKQPLAQQDLRQTAWLVIGHSEFELLNYDGAEMAYQEALLIMADDDSSKTDIIERLAASVYKQAERAVAAGDHVAAADQFLRVALVAPTAIITATAQYDAANAFMTTLNYSRAIEVLVQFRKVYPNNSLAADIPAKLAVAYQETQQWVKAATELTVIYEHTDDPAVKQESLYQAADLYQKGGDIESAIPAYRRYAHAYPEPFSVAMEARFKLSQLYNKTAEKEKRRFWLNKIIVIDSGAGDQRTERSRYLAAFSANVFAQDDNQSFKRFRLTLPLKRSLRNKKKALNKVLASYQAVTDYGVQEFATQATFHIAEIYNQLSADLMASERPKGLDELALEQYELLLEDQAYPFEEKAIEIHVSNTQRSAKGIYDSWVQRSFATLKKLLPARYGKEEQGTGFVSDIY